MLWEGHAMGGMNRRLFLQASGCGALGLWLGGRMPSAGAAERPKFPNIVYILCDDLGYGDIKCLNPDGKIPTPTVDALAAQGTIFTDAHSGSAVCTPTRYGIMTGRYSWRTTLKSGVLYTNSPPLIPTDRLTVASMLKQRGYRTACIGKWHLGITFKTTDGQGQRVDNLVFSQPLKDGPNALGFDYCFGIPASLDMEDYYFIENDHVVQAPTKREERELGLRFHRPGLMAEDFTLEGVLPALTRHAVDVIDGHARDCAGDPLFLYMPLSAPHAPIVPNDEFKGRGNVGPYGDFVAEIDAAVAQVLDALDRNGMTDNTLVVFTSDNGFAPVADLDGLLAQGHDPSYVFRGMKADIFEGGHRIPFIARWPGRVAAGSTCRDTICLVDLMATAADITDFDVPDNAGEDSVSFLPALLAETPRAGREAVVHHSANGSFAIRQGKWKLIFCPDSGGWSKPTPKDAKNMDLPPIQLYDLEADIAEKNNVYAEHRDVVKRLTKLMKKYIRNGRSTPGRRRKNEGKTWMYRAKAAKK
jgi:arylsulfatase A-like enzyme